MCVWDRRGRSPRWRAARCRSPATACPPDPTRDAYATMRLEAEPRRGARQSETALAWKHERPALEKRPRVFSAFPAPPALLQRPRSYGSSLSATVAGICARVRARYAALRVAYALGT